MVKRISVFFDGTWSTADQANRTNVSKLHDATAKEGADGIKQLKFYDPGVGLEGNWLERVLGGIAGKGLDENVEQGYKFLINHYEEEDELFPFGYSRGAYTARSLAGLIRNCGLLQANHIGETGNAIELYRKRKSGPTSNEAIQFRERFSKEVGIKFLGVWDTVGSMGIPLRRLGHCFNRRYKFHDVELSGSVKNAYHALAIDEKRGLFKPSLWEYKIKEGQTVEQVWFAGVHSSVGGGASDSGLSDIALMWLLDKAQSCGLSFDVSAIPDTVSPDWATTFRDSRKGIFKFLSSHMRTLGRANSANEAAHPYAVHRFESETPVYTPRNLQKYLLNPNHRVAEDRNVTQTGPEG